MSEPTEENTKAAPITLHGKLLEERLQLREHLEALERYSNSRLYQHLDFTDKVLCCAQLISMRFYIWVLHRRMKRL